MDVSRLGLLGACAGIALAAALLAAPALSGPASPDAEQLKSTLTPLGAEKAGTADGLVPAWTGATPSGGYRDDPFGKEAPLLTITSKNVAQYADKLNDGQKAMLAKYPDYSIVVYPTHRTASAPQWVYDATFVNATRGKLNSNDVPTNVYGGIPFPIPKTGGEAMWNHLLRWRSTSWQFHTQGIETGADGRHIIAEDSVADLQMPYYLKNEQGHFNGDYWEIHVTSVGPPLRIGEAVTGRQNLNFDKTRSYVYLAGQRRTRGLPNACCDTPAVSAAGLMTYDELDGFEGPIDRYNWKLAKKELYVPYNDNAVNALSNDVLSAHFMNPARVRWELHRVWQVEGTLRPGQRHQSPKAVFYLDEDTWTVVLSDRWDAHDQLWKTAFNLPFSDSSVPGVVNQTFGQYDLLSGSWFVDGLLNQQGDYFRATQRFGEDDFGPEALLRGAR